MKMLTLRKVCSGPESGLSDMLSLIDKLLRWVATSAIVRVLLGGGWWVSLNWRGLADGRKVESPVTR